MRTEETNKRGGIVRTRNNCVLSYVCSEQHRVEWKLQLITFSGIVKEVKWWVHESGPLPDLYRGGGEDRLVNLVMMSFGSLMCGRLVKSRVMNA